MSKAAAASPLVSFVGGGNMARSLIGGLIARGHSRDHLCAAEPDAERRQALAEEFGIRVEADNLAAITGADAVVLAVKPQVMRTVCEQLATHWPSQALAVSIAAGITSEQVANWLGGGRAVVRVMPNTPALLGVGASGLYANAATRATQRELAAQLLDAVGISVWIEDESTMDVVTALSGSGPAYAFLLAEAMQAAAEGLGLPADAARRLTAQTLLGAARMLDQGEESAGELRRRVTSPGGTTQAAVETLQAGGFEALVERAIAAASARGAELARAAGD